MEYPEIMRFKQAAKYLNISERSMRDYWQKWGLPGRKVGRSVLFSKRELIQWVESQDSKTPIED